MDLGLRGTRALVTGGSKGIGMACALALAAEGCAPVLVARSAEQLEAAAARVRAVGVDVSTVTADLSRPEEVERVVEEAGDVDVLVNNAGAVPPGDLARLDDETWRSAWDLKVMGYIAMSRLILPRLEQRGRGVIINVIGAAGIRPQPTYVAGGTGNAALMALTSALGSRSLRKGVRVVGVNPGLVFTDRMEDLLRAGAGSRLGDPERWQELVPTDPTPATPEQVADVVAFLASPRASHVTGCTLAIDGGESAR